MTLGPVAAAFAALALVAAGDPARAPVQPRTHEADPVWNPWSLPGPDRPLVLLPEAEEEPGTAAPARSRAPEPLPPAEPDPAVAPVVRDVATPHAERATAEERRSVVVRSVLGLALVVALAVAAAHPKVLRAERRLGVAHLVTAGLPFLLLGMAARHPAVAVLDDRVLSHLAPVLRIGLGWIGFVVGFRFDARQLGGVDERAVASAALFALFPFVAVVGAAGAVLAGGSAELAAALRTPVFLRDALVLGAAGCMAAATLPTLLPGSSPPSLRARFDTIVRLEEAAGVAALALVAAYFRPENLAVTWQIPGAAWLFITAGAGGLLGLVMLGLLQRSRDPRDFTVLALGGVAFASGAAGYLHLSSVAVCFVAAVVLANFPGRHQGRLRGVVDALERPIYLFMLVILGALWPTRSAMGWLLIPVFVGARLAGRWMAARAAARSGLLDLGAPETRLVTAAPVGSLAIAIVVNALLLYPGGSITDAVVAVVGGVLVTEAVLQAWAHPRRASETRPA